MKEPIWILESVAITIHSKLIAEHGGMDGLRDRDLLSVSLARPVNLFSYVEDVSLFDLAAAYAYGLAKNHPFIDGNKRVALATIDVFLRLNGYKLIAPEVEAVILITGLVEGVEDQSTLGVWIQKNSQQLQAEDCKA